MWDEENQCDLDPTMKNAGAAGVVRFGGHEKTCVHGSSCEM